MPTLITLIQYNMERISHHDKVRERNKEYSNRK
jgi:hypothetical protein